MEEKRRAEKGGIEFNEEVSRAKSHEIGRGPEKKKVRQEKCNYALSSASGESTSPEKESGRQKKQKTPTCRERGASITEMARRHNLTTRKKAKGRGDQETRRGLNRQEQQGRRKRDRATIVYESKKAEGRRQWLTDDKN